MQKGIKHVIFHVIGCIAFIMLPIFLAPDLPASLNIATSIPTQRNMVAYLLMIIFFYANYFIFIPKFYFTKRYFIFFLFALISFATVVIIPYSIFSDKDFKPGPPRDDFSMHDPGIHKPPPNGERPAEMLQHKSSDDLIFTAAQELFIFATVIFFSLILAINNRWKTAEQEKVIAELSYLKAQVNPHFLFNTLNSIYALALEKSDNTASAIVKLSEMMRYVLSDADNDFVSLEKELTYITDYIDLQTLRYGNSVFIDFKLQGNAAQKKIVPLILIAFVENAFKFGINAEQNSFIKMNIDIKEEELYFNIMNNKVQVQQNKHESTGLGLNNTKRRLNLFYPGKHSLLIHETEKDFTVELTLQLND